MTKNRLTKKDSDASVSEKKENNIQNEKSSASRGIIIKMLSKIFGGKYLETEMVVNNISYFIFLIFIGLLYITNTNIADKKIRDINKLNKELKELRSQYIISKSELMFLSKQSELAKRVEPLGLKETTQQPYLILCEDTTQKIY